jgi:hypothetical protein
MKRAPNEIVEPDTRRQPRTTRSRAVRRLLRLIAVASGGALGLAQLGGVVLADGPDTAAADRLGLNAADRQRGAVELSMVAAEPIVGQGMVAIGRSEPSVHNGNGRGNGGNGKGSKEGSGNGTNGRHESRAQSNGHRATGGSSSSHHGAGASTPKPPEAAIAGAPTSHEDNGLHLGQLFHQGINESRAQALLDALDAGSGLTAEEIQGMSLGELLQTAHGAGLSTEQVADILEANEVEASEGTP